MKRRPRVTAREVLQVILMTRQITARVHYDTKRVAWMLVRWKNGRPVNHSLQKLGHFVDAVSLCSSPSLDDLVASRKDYLKHMRARKMARRTCPRCGDRSTKFFCLPEGVYRCQCCNHRWEPPSNGCGELT